MLAVRQLNRRAGATADELPRIALEIDGRGTLAGRARAGRAVILPLEGDAKTLLLVRSDSRLAFRLRQRRRGSDRSQSARYGAGKDKRRNCCFRRHRFSLQVNSSPPSRARTEIFEAAPETLQPAASKFRGIRFAGFLRRLRAAQNIRASPC